MTQQPWQTAPQVTRGLKPYLGCLALVAVGGYHEHADTGFGDNPGVRVGLIILDGTDRGKIVEDQVLTNARLVNRLRGMSGGVALGRIVGEPLPGGKTIFDLADPTPQDQDIATGWFNAFPGRLHELIKLTVAAWEANEKATRAPARPTQAEWNERQPSGGNGNGGAWGGQQQYPAAAAPTQQNTPWGQPATTSAATNQAPASWSDQPPY